MSGSVSRRLSACPGERRRAIFPAMFPLPPLTDEQRAIVERGQLIASITSEPEQSFRDKFVLNTVFRKVPDGYHVAGVKQFCSLGDAADYYFVTGIVEGTTTAKEGVISALIPKDAAGVKIEGLWNATGM